jgi:hypothetical protein
MIALVATMALILTQAAYAPALAAPWNYLLALSPMLPIAFLAYAVVQFWRETDEFLRRQLSDSLVIAAALTALIAAGYGLLEGVGAPRQSAWWTWAVLVGGWGVVRCAQSIFYR